MAKVVTDRLTRTRDRIADLQPLADQLQVAAGRLTSTLPPGNAPREPPTGQDTRHAR